MTKTARPKGKGVEMGILKLVLFILILFSFGFFGYQNQDVFMKTQIIQFSLFKFHYQTPPLHNGLLMGVFFTLGGLVTFFFSLISNYKTNQVIRSLTVQKYEDSKTIQSLETELQSIKAQPATE